MWSERLLSWGDFVAVLVTAVHFAEPLPFPSGFWLDLSNDDSRRGPAPYQSEHDRLRPDARQRRDRRPRRDAEGAGARRALAGREAPLPSLRTDLAHLRRRPPGGRPPRQARRLAGARL